uniref:S ribonuclease n=1 Tax=Heterorhabditis bacteriophora TaxID=37862 RepID=A0A1I7WPX5_HETBA
MLFKNCMRSHKYLWCNDTGGLNPNIVMVHVDDERVQLDPGENEGDVYPRVVYSKGKVLDQRLGSV